MLCLPLSPQVTILFMDIVGFTSMSKEVPAEKVMQFLNELFSKFDAMCDYYDVYKVGGGTVDDGSTRVTVRVTMFVDAGLYCLWNHSTTLLLLLLLLLLLRSSPTPL